MFFIISFLIRNYSFISSFLQDIFLPTSDPSQTSRTELFAAIVISSSWIFEWVLNVPLSFVIKSMFRICVTKSHQGHMQVLLKINFLQWQQKLYKTLPRLCYSSKII